jgi:hypothetical protein
MSLASLVLAGTFLGSHYWLRSRGLTPGELVEELRRDSEPRFAWRSVDRKHWQAEPLTPPSSAIERSRSIHCASGLPTGERFQARPTTIGTVVPAAIALVVRRRRAARPPRPASACPQA